jgi:hypothetical protein
MAIIRTTLGVRANDNVDISSVGSPVGDAYVVTLASAPPADTVVGDTLSDETATTPNTYLISAINGADLTARDVFGAGVAPSAAGASQAFTTRTYATINEADADLDDTAIYATSDVAEIALCESISSTADERLGTKGDTVGLSKIKLVGHENYRHNGDADSTTGQITAGAHHPAVKLRSGAPTIQVSWILVRRSPTSLCYYGGIDSSPTSAGGTHIVDHCIVVNTNTGTVGMSDTCGIGCSSGLSRTMVVDSCIVRNFTFNSGVDGSGIWLRYATATIRSCTVEGCAEKGIVHLYGTVIAQNCIASNNGTDYETSSSWGTGTNYNISEDATAPGAASITGEVSADLFVDPGTGDLHIKSDSAAIGAGGNYEGETIYGYSDFETDVDGDSRPASPTSWDSGADYYVAPPLSGQACLPAIAVSILGL